MKFLIILFILFISSTLKAQEGYFFSKEQHDQIRKNLNDYKILIKDYDDMSEEFKKLKNEFEILVKKYEFTKMLHDKNETEARKYFILYENSDYENKKIKLTIENLNKEILSIEPEMIRKDRMIIYWKTKYSHELKYNRIDRIIGNFVFGSMVGASLIAIYVTVDRKNN